MALVIGAVAVSTRARPPAGATRRMLGLGILMGILAMLTLALGIVIIKPVLGHAPLLQVVTVRQLCALACLLPVTLLSGGRRRVLGVFRPSRSWRFMLPGAFLGSFLALVLWVAGMKYALVGVAAVLNQTSTIFIILLATLFLKEPFTRRRLAATGLAVGGIALVMLG
jgi:drug/metabolite transporter (DMT)-like permease